MSLFPEQNNKADNPNKEDYANHISLKLIEVAKLFDYDHIQDEEVRGNLIMNTAQRLMTFIQKLIFVLKLKGDGGKMGDIIKDLEATLKKVDPELNAKFEGIMKNLGDLSL